MKVTWLIAASAVAVSASPVDSVKKLNERTLCLPSVYQFCCGGTITFPGIPSFPFNKRELDRRTLCLFCECQSSPQPQPTTTPAAQSTTATTTSVAPPPTTTTSARTTTAVATPSTTASTTQSTTTSVQPPPAPSAGSCQAVGNGGSVGGYQVSCGTDYPGGDLSNSPSSSFSGCATLCDKLPGCLGFSYVGGNNAGVCYFKSKMNSPVSNPNVDSGFRPSPNTPANPTTTTTTTTQAPPPATTTTSAVTTPTAAPSSCAALTNNPPAGYTVSCRTDRPGGDLSNAPAASFAACAPLCNALPACAGFAYVGGNNAGVCYFKSSLTGAVASPNVDFGAKNNFTPASTTTTSVPATTTTRAPVYTCLCPAVTF